MSVIDNLPVIQSGAVSDLGLFDDQGIVILPLFILLIWASELCSP